MLSVHVLPMTRLSITLCGHASMSVSYYDFSSTICIYVLGIPYIAYGYKLCAPCRRCYERDFMLSLNSDAQSDNIKAVNNTSRYLEDIFNINNPFFYTLFPFKYRKELSLNKTKESNLSAPVLDFDLSTNNGIISSKIYDKRDDFDFAIVNYPHLDGDIPHSTSYGVYISQLIRFARACSSVEDFHIKSNDHRKTSETKLQI